MARQGGASREQMTLRGHLLELRNRLFLVAGVLLVAATVAYIFKDPLTAVLVAPLEGRQLYYLTPGGGFKFIFNIVFFVGLAVALPLALQQLYVFLSPLLSDKIRRRGHWLIFWSLLLLAAGVCFGYFFAIPGALRFLYGFADSVVTSTLTADSYLSFIIAYTLGLGLVFQIPLIVMITHWLKPQRPIKLLKFERWVILIAFIMAAFITPTPDPMNQAIIAVPIIVIYQAGVIAVWLSVVREGRRQRRASTPAKVKVPVAPAQVLATAPSLAEVSTPLLAPTPVRRMGSDIMVRPRPAPVRSAVAPVVRPSAPTLTRRASRLSVDGVRRRAPDQRTMAPAAAKKAEPAALLPTAVNLPALQPGARYIDGIFRPTPSSI